MKRKILLLTGVVMAVLLLGESTSHADLRPTKPWVRLTSAETRNFESEGRVCLNVVFSGTASAPISDFKALINVNGRWYNALVVQGVNQPVPTPVQIAIVSHYEGGFLDYGTFREGQLISFQVYIWRDAINDYEEYTDGLQWLIVHEERLVGMDTF